MNNRFCVLPFCLLLSSGPVAADETYLVCSMDVEQMNFTLLIDRNQSNVTHSYQTVQFKAEAYFTPDTLSYKRFVPSDVMEISETYTINRKTLDVRIESVTRTPQLADKSLSEPLVRVGKCSITEEVETKF